MMWPILTKVQYEALPRLLVTRKTLTHIALSVFLNWVVAPLVMLALAWATLPDLPGYRTGVIMVGIARCIAMVMVWNQLAGGDANYCAVLVVLNSVLQIALYSPYAVWFVNIMGGAGADIHVSYGNVAISVLIYLGIPLGAGLLTRALCLYLTSRDFFTNRFLPLISPLGPLGLLYTIVVLFAYQGHHIIHDIGPVFRVIVPLVLYFTIMWAGAFALVWWLGRRARGNGQWSYEMAVVQSFTAGSNNFVCQLFVRTIVVTDACHSVGACHCSDDCSLRRRFGAGARGDNRAPCRGPGPARPDVGGTVPRTHATLGSAKSRQSRGVSRTGWRTTRATIGRHR